MARVLCMTEFLDKDPVRLPSSRSRSRSPSGGPRRQHRDNTPSSSAAASRSHSREHRLRSGVDSPTVATRKQCCAASESGHSRVHHQLSTASAGVAARLAPRDDNPDCSPVYYAGGYGHPAIEADIREIRKMLKSYVTRLENKDAAARTTKEWRIVARVLDRIFFFCYIGTIVVSLFTIFPRDNGDHQQPLNVTTTSPPADVTTDGVDIEPVTVSDLSFVYNDYGGIDYR